MSSLNEDLTLEQLEERRAFEEGFEKFCKNFGNFVIREVEHHGENIRNFRPSNYPDESKGEGWMMICDFSVENCIEKIDEYMKAIKGLSKWTRIIELYREVDEEFSKNFIFEVRFCLPTNRKPSGETTVGIFFTIELLKGKSPFEPVDVSFSFEGSQMVYTPDDDIDVIRILERVYKKKLRFRNLFSQV